MWLKYPGYSSRQWELPLKVSFLILLGLSVWYLTGSCNNAKVKPCSSVLLDSELRGRGEIPVAAPAALLSGGGLSWPSHFCNASFTFHPGPSAFLSTAQQPVRRKDLTGKYDSLLVQNCILFLSLSSRSLTIWAARVCSKIHNSLAGRSSLLRGIQTR